MLSRVNKKIILLCSVDAPFWEEALNKVTRLDIKRALGISPTTMLRWEMGGEIRPSALQKSINMVHKTISEQSPPKENTQSVLEKVNEIKNSILDDSCSVYSFGEIIGFNKTQSQQAIDKEIFKKMPVFRDIYYEDSSRDRSLVQKHFDAFGGCYFVYIEHEERIAKGVLRVRYPLHLQTLWTIRAKFNLPKHVNIIGKQKDYFEYDGFLSIKNDTIYWMFEERDNLNADFFQMITERPDLLEGGGVAQGKYLTTHRGRGSLIISGRVVLERVEKEDLSEIEKFMHEEMENVNDRSFESILESLEEKASSI